MTLTVRIQALALRFACVAAFIVAVVAAGTTAPPAAALDCRAIEGYFRNSTLCQAVNTPASNDWGVFWTVKRGSKRLASCELAMQWGSQPGNSGITAMSWTFPKKPTTVKVTDTTFNVTVRLTPKATIKMTRPTWSNMTAYQTAALNELMRRLEAHEAGHVRVLAEVARLQTGTALVDTTLTSVTDWYTQYQRDSADLVSLSTTEYDDATTHGITQAELGGENTTVEVCDPQAAILGNVPEGTVNVAYQAVLHLGKQNPDDADIVITNPIAWAVTQGALPPGINLANGTLSGTPTQAGQFSFTVRATDANGMTADRDITLTVKAAKKAALLKQDYGVGGTISVTNTGSAEACHGAGFRLTSDEEAGTGTEVEYDLSSTTDRLACHAPSPTAVGAAGVPAGVAHSVSVSATAGVCTHSSAAELDAGIDPSPNEDGLAMRATASISAPQQSNSGCGSAVSRYEAGAGVTYTFVVTGGTAVFTWDVSECVIENWPAVGFPSTLDVRFTLRKGTTPPTTTVVSQSCTSSFGTSPTTLTAGTYVLDIHAGFNFANGESPTTADALGRISATATVVPT